MLANINEDGYVHDFKLNYLGSEQETQQGRGDNLKSEKIEKLNQVEEVDQKLTEEAERRRRREKNLEYIKSLGEIEGLDFEKMEGLDLEKVCEAMELFYNFIPVYLQHLKSAAIVRETAREYIKLRYEILEKSAIEKPMRTKAGKALFLTVLPPITQQFKVGKPSVRLKAAIMRVIGENLNNKKNV